MTKEEEQHARHVKMEPYLKETDKEKRDNLKE